MKMLAKTLQLLVCFYSGLGCRGVEEDYTYVCLVVNELHICFLHLVNEEHRLFEGRVRSELND